MQKLPINKYIILMTVIFMDLLAGMEFDLFVPSFPELQDIFQLTAFEVTALLSVNFIGYGLSLFFVGILADQYGRKPIILIGLWVFIAGSILCLWAPNYWILLIGRFLQGIGVAAPAVLSFLLVADLYPVKEQQFLLAILNGVMNASVGISPVIGSYITLYFHWHGNFTALLILGFLVLLMTYWFVPRHELPHQPQKLTFKAYLPIFRSLPTMLLILYFVFAASAYWVFVGISPLLYMEDLGVSLQHFGYYQGFLAFIFAIGSLLYGFAIKYCNPHHALKFSIGLSWVGCFVVAWFAWVDSISPLWITLASLPFTIAQIIPVTILYPVTLELMPEAKARVSAFLQAARLGVSALGLQWVGYVYIGSFKQVGVIMAGFMLIAVVLLMLSLRVPRIRSGVDGIAHDGA